MIGTGDIVLEQGGRAVSVLTGVVTLPRLGVWRAEIELEDTGIVAGPVTLRTQSGGVRFEGYTKRAGDFLLTSRCVVWGGAGGMRAAVAPLYARGPQLTVRMVARDLLRAAGETLDESAAQPELDATLAAWTRRRGPAMDELWRLVDTLGLVARVLPNGKWFVGAETWLEVPSFEHEVLIDDPGALTYELGLDEFVPALLPGRYFGGRKVGAVSYAIGGGGIRAKVTGWRGPGSGDAAENQRAAIQQTIGVAPDGVLWPAYVDAQHGDGTLDVTPQHDLAPEARTLPALVGVPIRGLAPGVTVTVPVGSIVHVGFEQGRADRPYASAFDTGTLNLSGLKLGANATKGVAREDDPVEVPFTLTIAPTGPAVAVTIGWTDANGTPQVLILGFTGSATLNGATSLAATPLTFSGKISAGSTKILAEG